MDISKEIKIMLIRKNMTITQLAKKLNTTQSNVSAKLKRNNFSIKEMQDIANALDYTLEIKFKEKNKNI